ncbi:MAG: hypothetical protein NUV63_09345 [Gallionella sp.]|nr:hypothetical protein [Gallionella sp.]
MSSNLYNANTNTPAPGHTWRQLSDNERLVLVNNTVTARMAALNKTLVAVEAKLDGQVIIRLLEPVPADKRGTLLLDLEAFLKESIDPGLVVWLEPFGDRSSLRNLRGIEVKS